MKLDERYHKALNKLTKWRNFFAIWQTANKEPDEAEHKAIKDHREVTMLLRVEVTTLARMMVEKGVCTTDEFAEMMIIEAKHLERSFETAYPGYFAEEFGLSINNPEAAETMRKLRGEK